MNAATLAPMAPVAKLICSIVKDRPGIHFRELGRAANVSSTGQLRHHIDRLGRRGALLEVEDGRFRRYFVPGDHDARVRHGLARFSRRVPSVIARALIDGPLNRTSLRRRLGCADSTLGYHLRRMVRAGDLNRTPTTTCCLYGLSDPPFVREILRRQDAVTQRLEREYADAQPSNRSTVPTPNAPSHGIIAQESASTEPSAPPWA